MDAEFANGKSVIPQPWSSTQETGFNYNDASGYTYWIHASGVSIPVYILGGWKDAIVSLFSGGAWKVVSDFNLFSSNIWKDKP
jgi:hypothetical protein